MGQYKILLAMKDKEIEGQHGKLVVYKVSLEGVDSSVEVTQKPETPAPTAGQILSGTIQPSKWGNKFKKEYTPQGHTATSKPSFDSDGAAWGNALNVAVVALQNGIGTEDLLKYATTLFNNRPDQKSKHAELPLTAETIFPDSTTVDDLPPTSLYDGQ